jgi:hypothetical protein
MLRRFRKSFGDLRSHTNILYPYNKYTHDFPFIGCPGEKAGTQYTSPQSWPLRERNKSTTSDVKAHLAGCFCKASKKTIMQVAATAPFVLTRTGIKFHIVEPSQVVNVGVGEAHDLI